VSPGFSAVLLGVDVRVWFDLGDTGIASAALDACFFCAEFAETIEIAEEAVLAFGLETVLWLR
jgi:hypothetical protein